MPLWINNDNLPVEFGPDKAIADLGGDYLAYGEQRVFETLINLGATSWGAGGLQNAALPSSFSATATSFGAVGIVSPTALFPLQPTAPVTAANSSGVLNFVAPQLRIEQIDLDCLIAANAGTGGATGLTGIGLVTVNPSTHQWAQVTPNAGVQFLGACANARMTAGAHYTWYADGTAFGTGTPPTAGSWLGNVPLVNNAFTPLPAGAYVSAIAAGGTYTGSSGGGLLKLRIRYTWYGNIAN
jgi:hypothetical protein